MEPRKYRIGLIALHPVQYHSPLYKMIAESPSIDSNVIYLDTLGVEGVYDEEFKTAIVWDVPLLSGYRYEFIKNYARYRTRGFFCRINPGLFGALRRGRYDAVFIQGYALLSCWIALIAAKLLRVKIIWRGEVAVRPEFHTRSLKRRIKNAATRWFLQRCDALLYTCHGNREFLEMHGIPAERLFPFPCAVDNDRFREQFAQLRGDRDSIKAALGIPASHMVVLFCGRLTQNKRVMDALKAVALAGASDIAMIVLGDGPQKDEAEAFGRQHGINLCMPGFVNQSEIAKYCSIADVFVLISELDQSPKALNEALNFAIVPIVTDVVGTARDLVIEGESGYVVQVGDVEAIAERLAALRNNPDKRHSMAMASNTLVARSSFEADVEGLLLACRSILRKTAE